LERCGAKLSRPFSQILRHALMPRHFPRESLLSRRPQIGPRSAKCALAMRNDGFQERARRIAHLLLDRGVSVKLLMT
jgi:hypothetical protein